MPTIDSKSLIDQIISNNGYYYDDPQVLIIHTYINQAGHMSYHVSYTDDDVLALYQSPYCDQIKPIWKRYTK